MTMNKLECKSLSAYFGEQQILKDISLTVEAGITAFIGPSGCGKSTLLKCFNRINDLENNFRMQGKIFLEDTDISSLDQQLLRRNVGMVFQRPTPFAMSVYDNVAFGPRAGGMRDKKMLESTVERSLRDASLWEEVKDRLHHSARGLSGGQQQRLCIARALAVSPKVLLLDEPTSALDPISTERIEQTLHGLKGQLTMVLVSHNMRQVRSICDRTAFFEKGRMIEYNVTEKIFLSPQNSKTAQYVQR